MFVWLRGGGSNLYPIIHISHSCRSECLNISKCLLFTQSNALPSSKLKSSDPHDLAFFLAMKCSSVVRSFQLYFWSAQLQALYIWTIPITFISTRHSHGNEGWPLYSFWQLCWIRVNRSSPPCGQFSAYYHGPFTDEEPWKCDRKGLTVSHIHLFTHPWWCVLERLINRDPTI